MRAALFSWESLHSIFLGGLGVHVSELAAGLARRGHETHLITRRGDQQAEYDLIDGVHYHRVDHGVDDNFIVSMDFMCQAMAHRFHEITSMVGGFDLAHAHDWLTGNAMKYAMDGHGVKGLLSMHSTEFGRDGNVFYEGYARDIRDAEAAACFHADQIIAVSAFLAEEVERIYNVPHEKVHVVPNGVNFAAFDGFINPAEVKEKYGIAPMAPMVFAAGRMTKQKGMDTLVQAMPMILHTYPEARFVISGSGPERQPTIDLAHATGVASSCVFLEALARPDYIDLVRAADVIAVPSRNEPFGIVVLEAWAAGKPVVATTAGGPRDFVWNEVNGMLVEANPRGIAHGIGALFANHEWARELGANGRKAVEETFNWDNVAGYTEGVYQNVIDRAFV